MKQLHIEKFKCFHKIDIPLNQLTIFVGANGYGKSTCIQSLLLLKKATSNGRKIYLDDVFGQNLGTYDHVCNKTDESNEFSISINTEENELEDFAFFRGESEDPSFIMNISNVKKSDFDGSRLYYLSAERIGPRISQPLAHLSYRNVGVMGQHTAQVIESFPVSKKLDERRCFPESKNKKLEAQVNEWLGTIFPNVKIKTKKSLETLTAQILIGNDFSSENFTTNIGFGISYVLPIIVTCLIASENAFVIIENPEAHLHPTAQAAMGKFLAKMSHAGLNIIVETHSDHIIEGIQLYVAENPEWHDCVTINCFGKKETENQPGIESVIFDENAVFSAWPEGFMDQSQINFSELRRIRKYHG